MKQASTVRAIADKLNISATTVSRAMNNRSGINPKTRQRVLEALKEAGYERKVGLRTSRYIGFVYPHESFRTTLGIYHAALLGGVLSSLSHKDYDFAMVDLAKEKKKNETYTQFFHRKEIRGVILQSRQEDQHVMEAISNEGFPAVLVASHLSNTNLKHPMNSVECDSQIPTRQAVEYLINLGHRRIAFVTGNWHDHDLDTRYEGFLEAMAQAGLEPDPTLVFRVPPDVTAGMSTIRQMISLPNVPTAAVFTTQYSTMGGLRACRELGIKVPEDFSIVGFDDYQTRFMSAPVYTSICQDAYQLGYDAAQILTRTLEGSNTEQIQVTHQAVLEINATTAPPKKG